MYARKIQTIAKAFTLQEDHLERLYKLLSENGRVVTIKVSCVRDFFLRPRDLDALLEIENVVDTEIDDISFSARGPDACDVSIQFDRTSSSPIQYTIDGEQAEVSALSDNLDRIVALSLNRYGWLSVAVGSRQIASAVFFAIALVALFEGSRGIFKGTHRGTYTIIVVVSAIFLLQEKLVRYFYPVGQFGIGRGKNEIEQVKQRRVQFGIGALVFAGLTGLFVNFISSKFGW